MSTIPSLSGIPRGSSHLDPCNQGLPVAEEGMFKKKKEFQPKIIHEPETQQIFLSMG